jgi:hypothetical protein
MYKFRFIDTYLLDTQGQLQWYQFEPSLKVILIETDLQGYFYSEKEKENHKQKTLTIPVALQENDVVSQTDTIFDIASNGNIDAAVEMYKTYILKEYNALVFKQISESKKKSTKPVKPDMLKPTHPIGRDSGKEDDIIVSFPTDNPVNTTTITIPFLEQLALDYIIRGEAMKDATINENMPLEQQERILKDKEDIQELKRRFAVEGIIALANRAALRKRLIKNIEYEESKQNIYLNKLL